MNYTNLDLSNSTKKHFCPYCNKDYYIINYTTSTAMYYPPIYKECVNINQDKNYVNTHCTCLNCGNSFSY